MRDNRSKLGVSAFVLMASGILCKGLGALFRLPLTNLLGIEGIGLFQLIMSLFSFALVITCGGVATSLSKLIGSARAKGEYFKISIYLKRAVFISVGIGLLIGALFLLFGRYIANFQGIFNAKSYHTFVLLLPLGAVLATLRGFFQGHENMLPTAISQVVEQVFKFVFGLLFAFYLSRFGVEEGVFGAFLGIVLSELVAVGYLFFLFVFKTKGTQRFKDLHNLKLAKREFDKANFSLTFSASILPLVNAFDALVIVPRLMLAGFSKAVATKLYGLQVGVVGAILNFPLVISMAVATTLLPNISYLISRGNGGKYVIERGLKLLLFLILPTTFGMVAISKAVLGVVYQDLTSIMLNVAFELMFYGAFSIIFTALMQYLVMLLQANGQFKFISIITLIGGIAKAVLSFVLSANSSINIFALVLGNIALTSIVCLFALARLKKIVEFSLTFGEVFTLLFGTFSMFLVVYSFVKSSYFSPLANILVAIVLGVIVYVVMTMPFSIKIFKRRQKLQV